MDIALALGGGGTKGIAHIGVISELENNGFHICAIAGTSAGGLVGSVYAAGYTPLEILKAVQGMDMENLYRRRPDDGPSIMGIAGLVDSLTVLLGKKTFADLKIPFACTAVDINTQREIYMQEGLVMEAILATMAVPGILPPRQIGKALLVDGGVLDPVPVILARKLAPNLPIIAVALQPPPEDWDKLPETTPIPIPSMLQGFARLRWGQALRIFAQSMDINSRMVVELRLKIDRPDVIIRPDVNQKGFLEIPDPLDMMEAGKQAALKSIPAIKLSASWQGKMRRFLRPITPIEEPVVLNPDTNFQPAFPTDSEIEQSR